MATNRIETLDPALIRPGRIDRKIEFPLPDEKTKRRIFSIHTNRMTLAEDVSLEDYVMAKDDLSGADIKVWHSWYSSLREHCMTWGATFEFVISRCKIRDHGWSKACHVTWINNQCVICDNVDRSALREERHAMQVLAQHVRLAIKRLSV